MKRLLVLCGGIALLIVTPSNAEMFFNGLPWTTWPEIVTVVFLVYLFGFGANRQAITRSLSKLSRQQWMSLVVVLGVLISMKCFTFVFAPTEGQFEACYRSVHDSPQSKCARTFEPIPILATQSVFFDRRSTSVDSISFHSRGEEVTGISQTNWRLPMINSWEFDDGWRMWNSDDNNIEIFPFRAEFRGPVKVAVGEELRVRYVGEGRIVVDGVATPLPASYEQERIVILNSGESRVELRLEYSFLRTETYGDSTTLPYAALALESGKADKFAAVRSPISWTVWLLRWISDLASLSIFGWMLLSLRKRLREVLTSILIGGLVQLSVMLGSISAIESLLPIELEVIVLTSLTVVAMKRGGVSALMFLGYLITAVSFVRDEIFSAFGQYPALSQVLVRLRGNDHLVYHAHVREMLTSGWLRGGENVYYFQPGIRYYFYLQNVLFGESGLVSGVLSVTLMGLGILFVASRLNSTIVYFRRLQYLGIVFLVIWWSSSHTTQSSIFGLSEFGTWIIACYIIGLMLSKSNNLQLTTIAVLGGVAVWIRPNQGLAMIGLVFGAAVFANVRRIDQLRRVLLGLGVMLMILLLMPIHNYVFGGVVAFQPVGAIVAQQLSWAQLSGIFENSVAQTFLFNNFKAAMYLPSFLPEIYSYRLALAILGFWITIVFILARMVWTRGPVLKVSFAAMVIAAQAAPFLKYTIVRYHPIQIVAIHLTAILVMLYLTSSSRSDITSSESASHLEPKAARQEALN
jgi:hypothetical protein